jgi:hypothetical protein
MEPAAHRKAQPTLKGTQGTAYSPASRSKSAVSISNRQERNNGHSQDGVMCRPKLSEVATE